MLNHLRLETLVGLGAASLLGYVLWGPKTAKPRAANAAGALAGLQNIGNSCFLNAVLQALASSTAVIRWLNSPPSASALPAHKQLRAALIDVIQVVNRTHPEQRADPFTPAGVVACLLRLGWMIRRDEQDTHEMLYVLVSTLQEEPPPPPLALCAEGLGAADGPVEADTGESRLDWGALGARMRGEVTDICGTGVPGGAGGRRRRHGGRGEEPGRGTEGRGALDGGRETVAGADVDSRLPKDGTAVQDTNAVSGACENGDTASMCAGGNFRAPGRSVDGRNDKAWDSDAAGDDSARACESPSPSSALNSPDTETSPASSSRPEITSGQPTAAAAPGSQPAQAAVRGSSEGSAGPAPLPGSLPAAGGPSTRQPRGIVHRVRGAGGSDCRRSGGPLRSPFTGTVSTQLVCLACQHKCAVRWENFESLSLPLPAAPRPQPLSLPALLGQLCARETVHDVACDACHRRGRFSKRTLVAKLPSALCLHLRRTTWQDNGQAGKRGDHVSFFDTLNMFPYTYGANVTTASPGRPVSPPALDSGRHTYRLTAVIVHTGGASSGHFVTYRRRPEPADDRWFYTSDTVVSRAPASEVFSSAAYMLFYDRVPPVTSPGPAAASPMTAALLSPVAPAMLSPGPTSPLQRPSAREGAETAPSAAQ